MGSTPIPKPTIALAGNPNVGKSSIFNSLTGLRHHTGNWPGKTVEALAGACKNRAYPYQLIDLPGTYSLQGASADEQAAARYISSGLAECVVVVCDGCALERSLILALQVIERAPRAVVCVNLMDEARKQGIVVDGQGLAELLGVPVVFTEATRKKGLDGLLAQVEHSLQEPPASGRHWQNPVGSAQQIAAACVQQNGAGPDWRLQLDRILVSRRYGVPIMLSVLFCILCLTVWGANYPAVWLEMLFNRGYGRMMSWMSAWPGGLRGILLDGVYATVARVLAVMLPPMAIFFCLFTVLEDVGYLPRMAFLLDGKLRRCGGCGKQALTMCMGLGCNAVGVTGCRIIDSPRQRLLAVLTNAMIPCNGRFPALILLTGVFCPPGWGAVAVAGAVCVGILGAMAASGVLSKTALRHKQSVFLLELPPLRRPRLGQILLRSVLDRTAQVALRALVVAAPAGALLWILANTSLLQGLIGFLEPFGRLLGMNGVLLAGFLFSLPANELLIPVVVLALTGAGSLQGLTNAQLLWTQMGLTWQMALCATVFTVFHWPCATTLMTVYRHSGSIKQTAAAFFLPTAVGVTVCMLLNGLLHLLG